jgi:hypothetical protein
VVLIIGGGHGGGHVGRQVHEETCDFGPGDPVDSTVVEFGNTGHKSIVETLHAVDLPEGTPAVERACKYVSGIPGQLGGTTGGRQCSSHDVATEIGLVIIDPEWMGKPTGNRHHAASKRRQQMQSILDDPPERLMRWRRARW